MSYKHKERLVSPITTKHRVEINHARVFSTEEAFKRNALAMLPKSMKVEMTIQKNNLAYYDPSAYIAFFTSDEKVIGLAHLIKDDRGYRLKMNSGNFRDLTKRLKYHYRNINFGD